MSHRHPVPGARSSDWVPRMSRKTAIPAVAAILALAVACGGGDAGGGSTAGPPADPAAQARYEAAYETAYAAGCRRILARAPGRALPSVGGTTEVRLPECLAARPDPGDWDGLDPPVVSGRLRGASIACEAIEGLAGARVAADGIADDPLVDDDGQAVFDGLYCFLTEAYRYG